MAPVQQWTLIAHHDLEGGLFDSSTKTSFIENAGDPSSSTYMIAGQDFSDNMVDGKYHLRLVYSGDSDTPDECAGSDWSGSVTLEWLQSSWVTEGAVTDFESVSEADISTSGGSLGCQFNGLAGPPVVVQFWTAALCHLTGMDQWDPLHNIRVAFPLSEAG